MRQTGLSRGKIEPTDDLNLLDTFQTIIKDMVKFTLQKKIWTEIIIVVY